MAREIYFQSVGNPTQPDRLPLGRPTLALDWHGSFPGDEAGAALRQLRRCFLISSLTIYGQLAYDWIQASHLTALAHVLLLVALCFVAFKIITSRPTLDGSDAVWPRAAMMVLAILYVTLSLPLVLHLLCTLLYLCLFTSLLAFHWIGCAAATRADQGHDVWISQWQQYAIATVAVPALMLFLAVRLDSGITIAMLPVYVAAQLLLSAWQRPRGGTLIAVQEAIISWFSYNWTASTVPGLFRGKVGSCTFRTALTYAYIFFVAGLCLRLSLFAQATSWNEVACTIFPANSAWQTTSSILVSGLFCIVRVFWTGLLPVIVSLAVPVLLLLPVLVAAHELRLASDSTGDWDRVIQWIQNSVDPIERNSLFMGRVAHDGSPLLPPRSILREHAHFLGDTGGGKTSLGLAPLIEQLLSGQDCSVIVIDLKADSLELLATLCAAVEKRAAQTGRAVPVKHFSNQRGKATFAFNPLLQQFWKNLDLYMRTDIQCGALGLSYGADYGEGYYSSANSAVLYHTIKKFPDVSTYRELADRVGYVIANATRRELHPEIRKAGVHVQTVLDRLGSFEALNVTPDGDYPAEVVDEAIDFARVFSEPQALYFHLSATLAPGSSPEIARLVTYSLLAASTQTTRKHQVYLVIDEFQRMVAKNIEYMLQLARSMGVGVILANQTMQDLRTRSTNLIPAIEANCRYRQWFAVSSADDRQRLVEASGETVDTTVGRTITQGASTSESTSVQERIAPRLTINDILLASDHPLQSIVRISRGAGYAQYGGMPFVVESNYHISLDEYKRRKALPWPQAIRGAFLPGTTQSKPPGGRPGGPIITTEVVGEDKPTSSGTNDPFASFLSQNQ
jgi:hypothetical protein